MKYFFSRFKYVKFADILSLFVLIIVFIPAMIFKLFYRDLWLICEDKNEARDNAYWLFKYIRENHSEQRCFYAVSKNSPDREKVQKLGKIVNFGTMSHWFWYLVADKNISTQKNGKPNAAICYFFEVCLGLRKHNRYFLQHGITINEVEFLFYKNAKFHKFFTATFDETKFIDERFGYPKNSVVLTGFPRFDNLKNQNLDEKLILVMPSWRNWIAREVECEKYEGTKIFEETDYFKAWNEFLNSDEIAKFLEKNDLKMIFYPHRNMQKYIESFRTNSKNIEIASSNNYDVQDLLNRAGMLITDYSSVFFDFAYLGKPIIFYQFDEEKFRSGQYRAGYFDYKNNEFSSWCNNIYDLISILNDNITKIGKVDKEKINGTFKYIDEDNSKRVYEEIKYGNKSKN